MHALRNMTKAALARAAELRAEKAAGRQGAEAILVPPVSGGPELFHGG